MASAIREVSVLQFDRVAFGAQVQVVDPKVVAPEAEFWLGTDGLAADGGATAYARLAREYRAMRVAPDRPRDPRPETG